MEGAARASIVLDTNAASAASEPAKAAADPAVVAWANAQRAADLFTTVITEAEMRFGLALLPAGCRRSDLSRAVDVAFVNLLAGRVLAFDRAAAASYGLLAARRRQAGRPSGAAGGNHASQIAAVAVANGATAIATRNVDHFAECGITVIDPWEHGA